MKKEVDRTLFEEKGRTFRSGGYFRGLRVKGNLWTEKKERKGWSDGDEGGGGGKRRKSDKGQETF